MLYTQLAAQLDWFSNIGIERFNFSVLVPPAMLNDNFPRFRTDVLAAAGWAWARNREGYNVYLRPASGPAWPVLLLDDVPVALAQSIACKYSALVIETSANNTQVWIATTSPHTVAERLIIQRALAAKIRADVGSVSGDHFGRAAGFRNRKPTRGGHLVDILVLTRGTALDATSYLAAPPQVAITLPPPRYTHESGGDESRAEFGWALGWLQSGHPIDTGTRQLTERALRRSKRSTLASAELYARKTFESAQAILMEQGHATAGP